MRPLRLTSHQRGEYAATGFEDFRQIWQAPYAMVGTSRYSAGVSTPFPLPSTAGAEAVPCWRTETDGVAMGMKNKKNALPPPFAALTKDTRFAGTYEVLVPVAGRVRPHRVPMQFESQEKAESWMHSPDGKDMIARIMSGKED